MCVGSYPVLVSGGLGVSVAFLFPALNLPATGQN